MGANDYWRRTLNARISRRRALQMTGLAGAGIAGAAVIGCGGGGGGDKTPTAGQSTASSGSQAPWVGGAWRGTLYDTQSKFDAYKFPSYTVQVMNAFSYSRLLKSMSGPSDPSTEDIDLPRSDWYRPVPDLAAKTESVDATTFVFTLQNGAVWHDLAPLNGRAVTPDDIVKSFEYYQTGRSDKGVNLQDVDSITATGPNTLQVKLKKPFGPFLIILSSPSDLYIYPPELIGTDTLNSTMIGTGPFVMNGYQQGVFIRFDKNPKWWEKDDQGVQLPYLDRYEGNFITDKNQEISQYSAGRLEGLAVPAELISSFRSQNSSSLIGKGIANQLIFMFFPPAAFDSNEPPFNDDRVRQAVSLALDREGIIDLASGGSGGKKHNLINAGFLWYLDPDDDAMGDAKAFFSRDLAKAKQLLSAAGQESIDTDLHWTSNAYKAVRPYYNPTAEAIPPMLRDAGINVKLVDHDYQSEWINPSGGIFYGGMKTGMAIALETPVNHPWIQFNFEFTPGNVRNHSHVNDAEMQSLLQQLSAETDFDKGQALAYQVQELNGSKMYYLPLIGPYEFTGRQPYTRTYDAPTSYGAGSEYIPHYQVDTSRQKL